MSALSKSYVEIDKFSKINKMCFCYLEVAESYPP